MEYLDNTLNFLDRNIIQFSVTIILVVIFFVLRRALLRLVKKHGITNDVALSREVYIKKLVNFSLILLFSTIIGSIWEISLQGLSVYFASIFTVVGIGLFAAWSILSNMTASLVLFFFFPYRIGDKIKLIDGDNSVEGEIIDITLFYISIKNEEEGVYSYPNNLAIQKPIRKNQ